MRISISINRMLFLDIESIPGINPTPAIKKAWEVFSKGEKVYEDEAALYAEFGQICCISVGYFNKQMQWSSKSYKGENEIEILNEFFSDIKKLIAASYTFICGHNIKNFDVPFIIRRSTILGIYDLPDCFEFYGKKPWDLINFVDTLEIWRCGQFNGGGSLRTLCAVFGLPSPKERLLDTGEIVEEDGKMVKILFANQQYDTIANYCQRDIKATANVFNKMVGNHQLIFKEL